MHYLNENKDKKGGPSANLKRSIDYILNPEKTDGGRLVWGNCGLDSSEIFESMLLTKRLFEKEGGRQGYHLIISFEPGECTANIALDLTNEFCERYLGVYFEYVFAIHTDRPHMHAHILFNSVSQRNGKKYPYMRGERERRIQPLIDELCRDYGLSVFSYSKNKKSGKSYIEYQAEKQGRLTQADVVRADIDMAILRSDDLNDYKEVLRTSGYIVQEKSSVHHGIYLTYHAPGFNRPRCDYHLGPGYRIEDIKNRIVHKEAEKLQGIATELSARYFIPVLHLNSVTPFLNGFLLRMRQTTNWQYLAFEREDQARVRRDLLKIDELREECLYLIDHNLGSIEKVRQKYLMVEDMIKQEVTQLKSTEIQNPREKERAKGVRRRYKEVCERLGDANLPDNSVKYCFDTKTGLEKYFPEILFPEKRTVSSPHLEALKQERKILKRILKEAPVSALVKEVPPLPLPDMILEQANKQSLRDSLSYESIDADRHILPEMAISL